MPLLHFFQCSRIPGLNLILLGLLSQYFHCCLLPSCTFSHLIFHAPLSLFTTSLTSVGSLSTFRYAESSLLSSPCMPHPWISPQHYEVELDRPIACIPYVGPRFYSNCATHMQIHFSESYKNFQPVHYILDGKVW